MSANPLAHCALTLAAASRSEGRARGLHIAMARVYWTEARDELARLLILLKAQEGEAERLANAEQLGLKIDGATP